MKAAAGPGRESGQVLPLTAIFMTALLLFAALAVDVSNVLSAERFYTATADASALAGAQELQVGRTRQVTGGERTAARTHAMQVLVDRLGDGTTPTTGPCAAASDVVDCPLPGTPFLVSIKTPSPDCVLCDPERSIQVTVRNPSFGLTFARLAGQNSWNIQSAAVAGLRFNSRYAVITFRPPNPLPNGMDQNRQDISLDGTNTRIDVLRGDVGTNTSAYTNSGNYITLASGYKIDHIDAISPDPWNKINGLPIGRLISNLIQDPTYYIASFSGAPTFNNQAAGEIACPAPGVGGYPADYGTILDDPAFDVTCYQPGIYTDNQGFRVMGNTEVAYLMPGAYQFDDGLDIRGTLMGGLLRSQPGVVLVIPQTESFDGNNAVSIQLNAGDESCQADSCRALPATDFAGVPVATPEGLVLTVEVPRDGRCFTGTNPVNIPSCTTANRTISLPGNGQLGVSGVIYAPSDNIAVHGDNTSQVGRVGQLIAWTITYGGGAKLVQDYPELEEIGILRLDSACTGTEACTGA